MNLYHFTDKEDLTKISPLNFGKNHYTLNDTRASGIKRAFFYVSSIPAEHIFKGSNCRYTVKINPSLIYDLDKDKQGIKDKFKFDIDLILAYCKKHFQGVSYTTSFKTVCLFYAVPIASKKQRKAGIYAL